jgi:hypothetical protein
MQLINEIEFKIRHVKKQLIKFGEKAEDLEGLPYKELLRKLASKVDVEKEANRYF